MESGAGPAVRAALRGIAEPIKREAISRIQHKTGRHGEEPQALGQTIKVGVTTRAVSIYSTSPYAAVQDFGGRVGYGAIIPRASASRYMTGAVSHSYANTELALEGLGDRIEQQFAL